MADHTFSDMTAPLLLRQRFCAVPKLGLTGMLALTCSVMVLLSPEHLMANALPPSSVNASDTQDSGSHHKPVSTAVGQVTLALGLAEVVRADGQTLPGRKGMALYQGDQLITRQGGHLHIRFMDNALVSVRPGSHLILEAYHYDPAKPEHSQVRFTLKEGVARSVSGGAAHQDYQKFRLNTPVAAIGVRGTDFTVSAQHDKVRTFVSEGAIVVAPFSDTCRSDGLGPCAASGVELKQQQAFIELQQSDLQTQLTRFALPRQPNSAMLTNERLISHVKQQAIHSAQIAQNSTVQESLPVAVISKTGAVSVPETSSVADAPSITESSSVTETSSVADAPSITESSSVTETSSVAEAPSITESSSVTETSSVADAPSITESSSVADAAPQPAAEPSTTAANTEGGVSPVSEGDEETGLTVAELVIDDESSDLAAETPAEETTPATSELPESDSLTDEYVDIQTSDAIEEGLDSNLSSQPLPSMVWSYSAADTDSGSDSDALDGLSDTELSQTDGQPDDTDTLVNSGTQVTEALPVPANSGTTSEADLAGSLQPDDILQLGAVDTESSISGDTEGRLTGSADTPENIGDTEGTLPPNTEDALTPDTEDALPQDTEDTSADSFIVAAQDVPDGFEALLDQGGFTLHRAPTDLTAIDPGLGSVSFALENAHAFYLQDAQPVSLEVLESRLEINFERGLFSTGLKLSHITTGDVDFSASGAVEADGRFRSGEGDPLLDGAATLDGQAAGYYFEKNLPGSETPTPDGSGTETVTIPDRKVQGITLWKADQVTAPTGTPPLTESPLQP